MRDIRTDSYGSLRRRRIDPRCSAPEFGDTGHGKWSSSTATGSDRNQVGVTAKGMEGERLLDNVTLQ
jgi:hypothetical protein